MNRTGVEYDPRVPDDLIVETPGGVSNLYHHYTKGMYSPESATSDIYGHTVSTGQYIFGAYGNMYGRGHTAAQALGLNHPAPDPTYWKNMEEPDSVLRAPSPWSDRSMYN